MSATWVEILSPSDKEKNTPPRYEASVTPEVKLLVDYDGIEFRKPWAYEVIVCDTGVASGGADSIEEGMRRAQIAAFRWLRDQLEAMGDEPWELTE